LVAIFGIVGMVILTIKIVLLAVIIQFVFNILIKEVIKMLIKKISNILLTVIFISIIGVFLLFPGKRGETSAALNLRCSLLYDVGCQSYYCWGGGILNNYPCSPCGHTGC